MMNDDGGSVGGWRRKSLGRRTRKGRNAVASRDMQTAKTCSQAAFFFPLRPTVEIYIARLPLCNVEPAGLALTAPIEAALYTPALYPSEILCFRSLRVGISAPTAYVQSITFHQTQA